jgi:hypothetical protein
MIPEKLKPTLNKIVTFSIKNHGLFLIIILFLQWLTGQIMGEPNQWGFLLPHQTARTIHNLLSKVIVITTIGLALDKLYLYLKRKGKI